MVQAANSNRNFSIPRLDKNGELALAYNLAFNRMSNMVRNLENKSENWSLNNLFGLSSEEKAVAVSRLLNFEGYDFLKDQTYLQLLYFLFKRKNNSSSDSISNKEKAIVNFALFRLWRLRDFHSHYYHNPSGLLFSDQEAQALNDLHNEALHETSHYYDKELIEKYWDKVYKRYPLFYKEPAEIENSEPGSKVFRIKNTGIDFFLSLFLSSGEMQRFLNHRQFCKANNPLEYKVKQDVYRYFSHRDGAHIFRFEVRRYNTYEERESNALRLGDKELMLAHIAKLDNYLRSTPDFIYNQLDTKEHENHLNRGKGRFVELAIQYLADFEIFDFEFKTRDYQFKQIVQKTEGKGEEAKAYQEKIFKKEYRFQKQLSPFNNWKIDEDGGIDFRMLLDEGTYAQFRFYPLHLQEILAMIARNTKSINAIQGKLKQFAKEYYKYLNEVLKGEHPKRSDYQTLTELYGENFEQNTFLRKLAGEDIIGSEDYIKQIRKAIQNKKSQLESALEKYRTEKTFLQYVNKKNKELNAEEKRSNQDKKGIRNTKNRIIKEALTLYAGRSYRLTRDEVNDLDRFHYLLDKEKNMEFLHDQNWEKIPNDIYNFYKDEELTSFDDLFVKSLNKAIYKIEEILQELNNQSWDKIHNTARLFGVLNYSGKIVRKKTGEETPERITQLKDNCLTSLTTESGQEFDLLLIELPRHFFKKVFGKDTVKSPYHDKNNPKIIEMAKEEVKNDSIYMPSDFGKFTSLHQAFDSFQKKIHSSQSGNDNDSKSLKKIRRGIQTRTEIKMQDLLLSFVLRKYEERFAERYGPLQKNQIRKKGEYWTMKVDENRHLKLTNRQFYSPEFLLKQNRIQEWFDYTNANDIKGKTDDEVSLHFIFENLNKIYEESRLFLNQILKLEQRLSLETEEKYNPENLEPLGYKDFEIIKKELMNNHSFSENYVDELQHLRNMAFHGHLPGKETNFKPFRKAEEELKKALKHLKK